MGGSRITGGVVGVPDEEAGGGALGERQAGVPDRVADPDCYSPRSDRFDDGHGIWTGVVGTGGVGRVLPLVKG